MRDTQYHSECSQLKPNTQRSNTQHHIPTYQSHARGRILALQITIAAVTTH
jgi:hypothetical protein